jgi:hypothetical protein
MLLVVVIVVVIVAQGQPSNAERQQDTGHKAGSAQ